MLGLERERESLFNPIFGNKTIITVDYRRKLRDQGREKFEATFVVFFYGGFLGTFSFTQFLTAGLNLLNSVSLLSVPGRLFQS